MRGRANSFLERGDTALAGVATRESRSAARPVPNCPSDPRALPCASVGQWVNLSSTLGTGRWLCSQMQYRQRRPRLEWHLIEWSLARPMDVGVGDTCIQTRGLIHDPTAITRLAPAALVALGAAACALSMRSRQACEKHPQPCVATDVPKTQRGAKIMGGRASRWTESPQRAIRSPVDAEFWRGSASRALRIPRRAGNEWSNQTESGWVYSRRRRDLSAGYLLAFQASLRAAKTLPPTMRCSTVVEPTLSCRVRRP